MTFAIVVLACLVTSFAFIMLAWRLDSSPGRSTWKRLWPEVFSGELAVTSAWSDVSGVAEDATAVAGESLTYIRG